MDNTQRFGNRVENYVKYRSHYPVAIVTYLQERFHFTSGTIADVGAGTGILTKLISKNFLINSSRQGPSPLPTTPGYMPADGSIFI